MTSRDSTATLILGFCACGPYRYARDNIQNTTVRWVNWGYREEYIHPDVLEDLRANRIASGTRIIFCGWNLTKESQAHAVRTGTVDHISYKDGYLALTVFLNEELAGTIDLGATDHFLCRYAQGAPLSPTLQQSTC